MALGIPGVQKTASGDGRIGAVRSVPIIGSMAIPSVHQKKLLGTFQETGRLVPSPSLPRADCLLVADPFRPGEAFLWGGWRGDELGDCFKLVLGIR
eukprot:CAMPEP_0178529712 /NCGR_PEP_ID=MMETSP0696-20121128/32475_1 /TAXON_ID=265572 /ORGANISM="Extubocellulus spinifer, Strain CCMP396" /LENGTH=95 /DNA_ID=CAMNT_0020161437 /DNA_START=427 /DNA_END=711 /DNA_ORIENTATION=+